MKIFLKSNGFSHRVKNKRNAYFHTNWDDKRNNAFILMLYAIAQCKMKSVNLKMQNERNDLSERLLNFAAEVIKLVVKLNKTANGRHIGGQLTRASTSAGANYEEACGAESRADFIHKLQIVLFRRNPLREKNYENRFIGYV